MFCFVTNGHNLVGIAAQIFACVTFAVSIVLHIGHGCAQVKAASVVSGVLCVEVGNINIAEGQVRPKIGGFGGAFPQCFVVELYAVLCHSA